MSATASDANNKSNIFLEGMNEQNTVCANFVVVV